MHNRLQLGNQLVSKIDLSVSKSIAFARDAMNEAAQVSESMPNKPVTTSLYTKITSATTASTAATSTKSTSTTATSTTANFTPGSTITTPYPISPKTSIKPSSMETTMKIAAQSSTLSQQQMNNKENQLETSTITQMSVKSSLSSGKREETKSTHSIIPTTSTGLSASPGTLKQSSSTMTSAPEQPTTTTDSLKHSQKNLLLSEPIQLVRKQILNRPQMSSTSAGKASTASSSVFTSNVVDLSKELGKLVIKIEEGEIRSKKKEQEETSLDSPLTMDIPPLLPAILDQSKSQLQQQNTGGTKEPIKINTTEASTQHTAGRTTEKCIDKKYSCTFWIKAHRDVCKEQERFMHANCPVSCNFCTV
uniref:ShKT domain-containing protein n=1 Tax=Ditylenchus dipsaci TaxID=166011 RepID=A0A915E880_9BILA